MSTQFIFSFGIFYALVASLGGAQNFPPENDRRMPAKHSTEKGSAMDPSKISDPYESKNANLLPKLTPLTAIQKSYIIEIIKAASNVIENKTTLEAEERLFGNGEFFFDKDPNKPTEILITYRDLKFKPVKLKFQRQKKTSPWTKATIFIAPRNFPNGMYQLDFDRSFFSGMTLEKSIQSKHPDESIKKINTFRFVLNENQHIHYDFSAIADVPGLDEKLPSHFFTLEISKDISLNP
jgi:hypothetical protein